MRLVRSLSGVVLAVVVAAVIAASAGAAQGPVKLGRIGSAGLSGRPDNSGGCECTAVQLGDTGTESYVVPYDGIITWVSTYIGAFIESTDTLQPETVNKAVGAKGAVGNEGIVHSLFGELPSRPDFFWERMSAHAGEVLAARFHDNPFIESTPFRWKSSASGDQLLTSAPKAVGGQLDNNPPTAEERLNLSAVLEPDEDHDGHGDISQDLCPGSPIATAACSGSLWGSDLQGEHEEETNCPLTCMYVQTAIGGASTATTAAGVIVRWRVLNNSGGPYRIEVVTPNPATSGGSTRGYHVLERSSIENVPAPAIAQTYQATSFPARVSIPAGAYVGLVVPDGWHGPFQPSPGGQSTYSADNSPPEGVNLVTGTTHNGGFEYDADIEPDVDGDGYGDLTQDSCPTSAAAHEGPCPVGPPAVGGPGTNPIGPPRPKGTAAPKISALSVKPKSFLAKPLGGAPAKGKFGTKVKLKLSVAAKVTLAIETKQGRRFKLVTRLTKKEPAGASQIPFSGRYRHAGKVVDLATGTYRLTATAMAGSATSAAKHASFTVLAPS
jgi:hypothetical protein